MNNKEIGAGSLVKTVLITGGTRGIGAAIAAQFLAAGYAVILAARNDNGLARKLGQGAFYVKADVCLPQHHARAVEFALRTTGRLDVYINCAGFSEWRPISKIDPAFLARMLDVNLKGSFWGCKAAAAVLSSGSSIINVASLAGKRGSANNAAYCASKFGVVGLTQSLAKELGSKGIRVNAVCPVYVETEGVLEALKSADSPSGGKSAARYLKDFTMSQTALKRLPTGAEVGALCVYLASDGASAVTGQSINVDCGVLPQ